MFGEAPSKVATCDSSDTVTLVGVNSIFFLQLSEFHLSASELVECCSRCRMSSSKSTIRNEYRISAARPIRIFSLWGPGDRVGGGFILAKTISLQANQVGWRLRHQLDPTFVMPLHHIADPMAY